MDTLQPTPQISWPLSRPPNRSTSPWSPQAPHHANGFNSPPASSPSHYNQSNGSPHSFPTPPSPPLNPSNLPGQPKSLSGISLRAFFLGATLGLSLGLTVLLLLVFQYPLWRAPFFLASLALFHFLEYYVTAVANTSRATIAAFLLSQNGSAYNTAHTLALLECVLSRTLLQPYYPTFNPRLQGALLCLGLAMMVVGQALRTTAMVQAGQNFNHTVQVRKKEEHELVVDGVYAWLRHPSYVGFFWWGLGTQVVMGNGVCFVGYAAVLWSFFSGRIHKEEELLVKFFGGEYVGYQHRTWVGIPFVGWGKRKNE